MKENIFGKDLLECEDLMIEIGEPKFRGNQLFQWIYKKKANDFEGMSNFSKTLRKSLEESYELLHGEIIKVQEDKKDKTKKYLIELSDRQCIESVLMYYEHGASLCVSTQAGCNMGCRFCASTINGKIRNLTVGEILDQIYLVEKRENIRISNVVIMGIGEPLDNYESVIKFIKIANTGFEIGQRKITLSTCGLIPEINALREENLQINLAVSLHSAFQEKRKELMPISKKYELSELLEALRKYFEKTRRQITFEYALIDGFNDNEEDIEALVQLLRGTQNHLNLIGLNEVLESDYKESKKVDQFYSNLKAKGINVTVRRKMGREIEAACGQLRKKGNKKDKVII